MSKVHLAMCPKLDWPSNQLTGHKVGNRTGALVERGRSQMDDQMRPHIQVDLRANTYRPQVP